MFDFIKRPVPATQIPPEQPDPQAVQNQARQAALAQAAAFANDEAGALAFLLRCEFADARLQAAEHVHSRAALEEALKAMRNVDRRVAKLLQSRLDILQQQDLCKELAQQCVDDALKLIDHPHLLPNQVAELDRAWAAID